MRQFVQNVFLLSAIAFSSVLARAAAQTANASCSFQDGKQISVRYDQASAKEINQLSSGKVWAPDKQPMLLFTQAELSAGGADIPVGAYSMYIRGGKENWTLIVNKDVKPGSSYDPHQDLAQITMPLAEIGQPQNQLSLVFGESGAKQCSLRIYFATTGTWADLHEK